MDENNINRYFFKTLCTFLIAILVFLLFKNLLPKEILNNKVVASSGVVVDSMALAAMSDTVSALTNDKPETNISTGITIKASEYSSGYGNLERFFSKLLALEKNKEGEVRIAYFSDSMTDGDLIVQDIRSEYQNEFGGKGVGFVGMTSLSAVSRGSVLHSYSKNWKNQSLLKTQKPRRPFGIDGQVAFDPPSQSTWIQYKAGNQKNSTLLYSPKLFYGSSSNKEGKLQVQQNNDSIVNYQLVPNKLLNTISINNSPKSIKYTFVDADSIPFYGVNFDDGRGVHVDNFSIRGNSGLPLSLLNKDLMNAFDRILNYDLIVIHYGANVVNYGTTNYNWYRKSMVNVVNHLKLCFPNADFLIISMGDKSDKIDEEMKTSPAVLPLIKEQRKFAEATGAGFLSLYELMGGEGSMVKWVEDQPSLANKDYTHFNIRGAKKVGLLIYNDLQKGYNEYKKLHN